MINSGIYNPFNFVNSKTKINPNAILKANLFGVIITGNYTSVVIKKWTDDATVYTSTPKTWTYNGVSKKCFPINFTLSSNTLYYVLIDGLYYSDSLFEKDSCELNFYGWKECSDGYMDWDNRSSFNLSLSMRSAQMLTPEVERKTITTITDVYRREVVQEQYFKQKVQFVAPTDTKKMLDAMVSLDTLYMQMIDGNKEIINLEVEAAEQGDGKYSVFTLGFEFKTDNIQADSCCSIINIDDIINPDTPPLGGCEDFTVAISESGGILTPNLTNVPAGTPTYKWYRNGVYLTSASTLTTTNSGDYRVDVKVGSCKVTSSYYIQDECQAFQIEVTKIGNEINATASNVPSGESVVWEVTFNGVVKSGSLPYQAIDDGVHYVRATAGSCTRIRPILINVADDDCGFTVDIDVNPPLLEADTDATTPTYLWEFEDSSGRSTIGAGSSVPIGANGIYFLTVTQGTCSKTAYLYREPTSGSVVSTVMRFTGFELLIPEIDLLGVTNPAEQLEVYVNGVMQVYSSTDPVSSGLYWIKADGKMKFFNTGYSNATIKVYFKN